jgi:hypothetical protein
MRREAFVFGVAVVAVAVGLALLLVGEAYGIGTAVPVGGAVIVLGVGSLTGYIAVLDG